MATVGPTNLPSFLSNDADFRVWAQGIHDALTACGMTQAADTGQINLATVTKPTSAVAAGYEIWRFSDTLQGTLPVFFKLEYGTNAAGNQPSLWLTVATATNGSGTLTGQVGARTTLSASSSDPAGSTRPVICQGDSGQIHLFYNLGAAGAGGGQGFAIERTRLGDGTPTADGFMQLNYINSSISVQHFPPSGGVPTVQSSSIYTSPGAGRSTYANDSAMMPLLVVVGKVLFTYMSVMDQINMTPDVVFTADLLGSTRTFRSVVLGSLLLTIPWS